MKNSASRSRKPRGAVRFRRQPVRVGAEVAECDDVDVPPRLGRIDAPSKCNAFIDCPRCRHRRGGRSLRRCDPAAVIVTECGVQQRRGVDDGRNIMASACASERVNHCCRISSRHIVSSGSTRSARPGCAQYGSTRTRSVRTLLIRRQDTRSATTSNVQPTRRTRRGIGRASPLHTLIPWSERSRMRTSTAPTCHATSRRPRVARIPGTRAQLCDARTVP